ncbi:MAG: ABC transporter permease [Lawsonibacter sp.]
MFLQRDPATMILGDQATPEQLTEWRVEHGLDKPFWEQFVNYIWGIVSRGDFGTSYHSGLSVTESIMERFPTTFVLAVATCSIAIICGVLLGILAANHQGTWIDNVLRILRYGGRFSAHFLAGAVDDFVVCRGSPVVPGLGMVRPQVRCSAGLGHGNDLYGQPDADDTLQHAGLHLARIM